MKEDLFLGQLGPLSELGNYAIEKKYAYQALQGDVTAHTLLHSFAKDLVNKYASRPGCDLARTREFRHNSNFHPAKLTRPRADYIQSHK
jgi:hypothetical protein